MPAANVIVEVEFTAGVWTDVSARVDLEQPFQIKGGRSDAFSDVGASTLNGLVLRNDDGAFTPGNPASPYFPNVRRNKRIRVKVVATSTVQKFLGFIDDWGVTLSAAPVTEARVSATDRFKILSRTQVPTNIATLEMQRQGDVFDCAVLLRQGDTARGQESGIGRGAPSARLTPTAGGFLTPLTEPPPGTRSGLHIGGPAGVGPLVYMSRPSNFVAPDGVAGWFRAPNGSTSGRLLAHHGTVSSLVWGASGALTLNRLNSDGTVAASASITGPWDDGAWHYFELRWTGTTATALIDTTTASTSAGSSRPSPRYGAIGGWFDAATNTASLVAYADYAEPSLLVGTPTGPTPDPFGASTGNLAGEPISTRLARVMGYLGFTDFTSPTTVVPAGSQDVSGSILDVVQGLARTEGTWAFIDPADGLLKFGSRTEPATPAITVDAEADLLGELEWSDPDTGDVNEVTAQGSGLSFTATDAASVAALGRATAEVQTLTADERYVQAAAEWRLAKALSPKPRVPEVTIDLLTGQTAGLLDSALAVGVGSRVRVTTPASDIGLSYIDLSTQGFEWTIGLNEFTLKLDTDRSDDPCGVLLNDDRLGRVSPAAGALTLSASLTAGATSCSVASTSGNLLTTAGGDTPLWLQIDGETVRVTAVSGASSPQTLTIERGQEGTVAAAHASGAVVDVHLIPTLAY